MKLVSQNFGRALLVALTASVILAAPVSLTAQVKLDQTVSANIGVASGRKLSDADIESLGSLGLKYLRTDFSWARTEKASGVYDFGEYITLAHKLNAQGIRPIFILNYGNPVHTPRIKMMHRGVAEMRTSPPISPLQTNAFVAWVVAANDALAPYNPVWEVWNEPDMARFWPPKPDAKAYAQLANATCSAMREAKPEAPPEIIGPAVAEWVDAPFLKALVANGGLDCFDKVSIHPYKLRGELSHDISLLAELRRDLQGVQPPLTLANSEWGRSVIGGVDEADQARYLVRSLISLLADGVTPNIWYNWRDSGTDPGNDQHHFGLIRHDGVPKESYWAIKVLLQQIGVMKFTCLINSSRFSGALFMDEKESRATAVVWNPHRSNTSLSKLLKYQVTNWRIEGATDLGGRELNFPHIEIGPTPIYVRFSRTDEVKIEVSSTMCQSMAQ